MKEIVIYFNNSSFVIKFQVTGKYLKIMQIRKIKRIRQSLRKRLKRRYRLLKIFKHNTKQCPRKGCEAKSVQADGDKAVLKKSPVTMKIKALMQNKEVQTSSFKVKPKTKCCATETANISLKTSAQQTIATLRYNLSGSVMKPITIIPPILPATVHTNSTPSQTELETAATGVQCKCRTFSGATQTDEVLLKTSCTQVWNDDLVINETKKNTSQKSSSNSKAFEQDAVIYMLNEIGELVLNQNHILSNNTKMLSQMTEMSMLSKMLALGQSWRKRARRCSSRRTKCITNPAVESLQKNPSMDSHNLSSKSTQTDEPLIPRTISQFSQTTINLVKPRRLLFLKKQK